MDSQSLSEYRSVLQDKLSKIYECLSLVESPLPLSPEGREKIRSVLAAYSRSLSFKLNKTYEDK